MKTKIIAVIIGLTFPFLGYGQYYTQYFDGADTLCVPNTSGSAICITIDSDSTNIWQIGQPQKAIFNSAATFPNAIMTDTSNYYPINNTSSFSFGNKLDWIDIDISELSLDWTQKLDMDKTFDGGIVEFSLDTGITWQNVFNNSLVYQVGGFKRENKDTLNSGEYAFSGTDTVWRYVGISFLGSNLLDVDSLMFRFTFKSDAIDNNKEGWIIDNIRFHPSVVLTVNKIKLEKSISVLPNLTDGRITISAEQLNDHDIIEKIELINVEGKSVQKWKASPKKFQIDISNHPNGIYFLNVTTNKNRETFKIMLEH